MKKYRLYNVEVIPEEHESDVRELQKFIINNLGISISKIDTYKFWDMVSDSWEAGWLSVDAHYEDETREEFILKELEKYGRIYDTQDY